ncbi:hypothetical protein C1631_010695 [Chryseobacterium phosphatilyticum]|uniref:Uncharacterized protein n=1 Tax=Chryseobacterium phosphatilyticum TaxID=475075 RepID=A0A316XDY9_9FLAO|nr:hypothetical protein C1631_010695 [Chryseobacterium phosphatilyticum]
MRVENEKLKIENGKNTENNFQNPIFPPACPLHKNNSISHYYFSTFNFRFSIQTPIFVKT